MKTLNLLAKITASVLFLSFTFSAIAQNYNISNFRPYDQNGVNMFETPIQDTVPFTGLKVRIGGNFAQQFQSLDHSNTATLDVDGDGVKENELIGLSSGFNLATANLNIDVQLYDGVRLNLITYLSSRHHPEAWVKGGYIQFDELKFLNSEFVDNIMDFASIRVGHMEVNYGDTHYRRTDNGNALYNPFVGNYIMDAFNTEIGAEVYLQNNGFLGMLGVTGGEIKGDVTQPSSPETDDSDKRSPSIIGKLGYDSQVNEDFRARVTGSVYYTASSGRNTLYQGDRGGSRYYLVMEAVGASTSSNFTSGRFTPGFTDKVTSIMGNVFLKYKGLEFFGTYETSDGRSKFETDTRNANQFAGDLIYRFGKTENVYIGGRYNKVTAEMTSGGDEVSIDRIQVGGGWFITPNILLKGEYVKQNYNDFPVEDILNGGEFNGVILEAVVGF